MPVRGSGVNHDCADDRSAASDLHMTAIIGPAPAILIASHHAGERGQCAQETRVRLSISGRMCREPTNGPGPAGERQSHFLARVIDLTRCSPTATGGSAQHGHFVVWFAQIAVLDAGTEPSRLRATHGRA